MNILPTNSDKKFQVERIILFSDAVFAIAITLLILEIKPPFLEGSDRNDKGFGKALVASIPHFIGFLTSFAMIGLFWAKHHDLFGYVNRYNNKLIFLNLLFLLSIVIMPYTTEIYSEYTQLEDAAMILPFELYTFNIVFCSVSLYFLWKYIGNPNNHLAEERLTKQILIKANANTLILPAVFLISLLIAALTHSYISRFVLFLIPLPYIWINKRLDKKYKIKK